MNMRVWSIQEDDNQLLAYQALNKWKEQHHYLSLHIIEDRCIGNPQDKDRERVHKENEMHLSFDVLLRHTRTKKVNVNVDNSQVLHSKKPCSPVST